MINVYESCPVLENERYLLRLVCPDDAADLLRVYSDRFAIPFFNSDNCHGDNFYHTTLEGMREAIDYWLRSYRSGDFVRWAVIDKADDRAVGTIELFHRVSEDDFNGVGVLRLDVGSGYELRGELFSLLSLMVPPAFVLFNCDTVITKAPIYAVERIEALKDCGFNKSDSLLIGHQDGYAYRDYWAITDARIRRE